MSKMAHPFYELAIMGDAPDNVIDEIARHLAIGIDPFGFKLGQEVAWHPKAKIFHPSARTSAAVAYFGISTVSNEPLNDVLNSGIPVIPIVSSYAAVSSQLPVELSPFNCLSYCEDGPQRIATGLLECAGLLPRQRRIFVSYRRSEATEAAIQLFNELSARHFDVFLDTHGILPAENFQAVLWHRLCDSDVLVMLDTPEYFESIWTTEEFGKALSKAIPILRVSWPQTRPSPRTALTHALVLTDTDFSDESGHLSSATVSRICLIIEELRSKSHAVRGNGLYNEIKSAVQQIGGTVSGVGQHKAIVASFANGNKVFIYPTVGVPTSLTMHNAVHKSKDFSVAVVYDGLGPMEEWMEHLAWLGSHFPKANYIKAHEVAKDMLPYRGEM